MAVFSGQGKLWKIRNNYVKINILENLENDLVYKFLAWIEDFDLFIVILRLCLKKKVYFQKKPHILWKNKEQIKILEICCMPEMR